MKVIVIRQPWAWLIVNGFKDVENRSWSTHYRWPLLIRAAVRWPAPEDLAYARQRRVKLPQEFDLGGIVGCRRFTTIECEKGTPMDGCGKRP
jgi:hypothetical protein